MSGWSASKVFASLSEKGQTIDWRTSMGKSKVFVQGEIQCVYFSVMCMCVYVCVSVFDYCIMGFWWHFNVYTCKPCVCVGVESSNWNLHALYYIYRNSSLSKFFDQFFAVLSSLRNERDHTTLMALVKRKVYIKDPVEMEYASFLTPYALGFVSKQLALRHMVRIIQESATGCQVFSVF